MIRFFARAAQKRGELYIYSGIGQSFWDDNTVTAGSVAEALRDMEGVTHLDVFLNSPGGNVFDGLTIYNQLKRFKATVHTHVDGIAASIASVIMLAGSKRFIAENGTVMVHNPQTIVIGDKAAMLKAAADLEKVTDALVATYVTETGQKDKEIRAMLDAETWMTAEDAKDNGFVHEVVDAKPVSAAVFDLSKYRNTPERLRAPADRSVAARMASLTMAAEQIKHRRAGAAAA